MFPNKQKMQFAPVGVGLNRVRVDNPETGYSERVKISHARPLPSKDLFDPTACIKAGVNLNQVNSKVFGLTPDSFANAPIEKESENEKNCTQSVEPTPDN